MNKVLVFDMDGTLGDFYGVDGWLEDLNNHNPHPYAVAKPRVDMDALNILLDAFRARGWKIVVTTWLAKNSTPAYDAQVRMVKREWLARYGFKFDEFHGVKYGTTKADCTRRHKGLQILIDDNEKIRQGWNNQTDRFSINANENIIEQLIDLLEAEF